MVEEAGAGIRGDCCSSVFRPLPLPSSLVGEAAQRRSAWPRLPQETERGVFFHAGPPPSWCVLGPHSGVSPQRPGPERASGHSGSNLPFPSCLSQARKGCQVRGLGRGGRILGWVPPLTPPPHTRHSTQVTRGGCLPPPCQKSNNPQANLLPNRFTIGPLEKGSGHRQTSRRRHWCRLPVPPSEHRGAKPCAGPPLSAVSSSGHWEPAHTLPIALCPCDHHVSPLSPRSEQQGATPGQPRILSRRRARPCSCLKSIELDLGPARVKWTRLESHTPC